jgi:CRP-like cAMP-binding protein
LTSGLSDDQIERLTALGSLERVVRRTLVPLDRPALVLVVDGFFRIYRNAAFVRDVSLGLAGRGDVLGAAAAFEERGAETGAEALSDGSVLILSKAAWEAAASADPVFSLTLAGSVARRLATLERRVEEQTRSGVEARVAAVLGELAAGFGTPTAEGVRLDLPLSQEDLARLAGTTRENCSASVAGFARAGLVRGGRLRGMLVLDAAGLRGIADQSALGRPGPVRAIDAG